MFELNLWFPNGTSHYLVGGLLIGAGVSLLYVFTGLMGGMSTVFSSCWSFVTKHRAFHSASLLNSRNWRLIYALGLLLGAWVCTQLFSIDTPTTEVAWPWLLLGGFIAGFGARLGNGCTSGHGICGMASLSLPSLLAVLVFLTTAIVTAHLVSFLGK